MFVCNFKINKKVIIKLGIIGLAICITLVFAIVGRRFYVSATRFKVNDDYKNDYIEINTNNYANILRDSHENIDKYVGKKIKYTGFVYKLYDFKEDQFVLARNMIISSDNQTVVVGFLCQYDSRSVSSLEQGCWVEAEGIIQKGNYHGALPVVKITNLTRVEAPKDELISPPSDTYIPE